MIDETPALLGGLPIRPSGPPDWPLPSPAIQTALADCYATGNWGRYRGPNVTELETDLARFHAVEHAQTCASGTLAVEIALRVLGVQPGEEVILGAYEFEPSFLAIHAIGAKPVLVDVSPTNATLDLKAVEMAIGPPTRAILATHLHGGLVAMPDLMAMAARRGVKVVEDAAQATGATVQAKPAGTWGDIGVLSFGGSKLLTAGRGGALLTQSAEIIERIRRTLARGIQQWAPLSELQAAVLRPQLQLLTTQTEHRDLRAQKLRSQMKSIPGLSPFSVEQSESRTAYYKFGFYFAENEFGLSRDVFVKAMRAEGIAMDVGFRALHMGRAASRYRAVGPLEQAEYAGRAVILLHHPVLSLGEEDVAQVAAAVRKTYRNAARLR